MNFVVADEAAIIVARRHANVAGDGRPFRGLRAADAAGDADVVVGVLLLASPFNDLPQLVEDVVELVGDVAVQSAVNADADVVVVVAELIPGGAADLIALLPGLVVCVQDGVTVKCASIGIDRYQRVAVDDGGLGGKSCGCEGRE